MREIRYRKGWQRRLSGVLSMILVLLLVLPCLPVLPFHANAAEPGDTIIAHSAGFHHYCIDGYGANHAMIAGDKYQYILPSETLSDGERAVAFWAMLSLQASFGNVAEVNTVVSQINSQAPAVGLSTISPFVNQEDLRKIIHIDSVRAKYGWLNDVLANEEKYLQMGGLLGGSGSGAGGNSGGAPAVLQGHTSPQSALAVDAATLKIPFDAGGGDAAFIASVPLKYSTTGAAGSFTAALPAGWSVQKTSTEIVFTAADQNPPPLVVQFDTAGTAYQAAGTFSSADEVYESCLQAWVCVECSGTHVLGHVGTAPLAEHQRLVFVEVHPQTQSFYAMLGKTAVTGGAGGGVNFEVYRHEEDFTSAYNLQMVKYDHETGQTLENAVFNLYERFDDKDEINREQDGAVEIYEGGEPYQSYHKDNPVVWDDFRFVSSVFTNQDGHAEKTINHGYHYDKTFCDGHPAPSFVSVPEEEIDPETGEVENEAEIEAAQAENMMLAQTWLDCFASCEAWSQGEFEGVHFHWLMDAVDAGEIASISGYGGSPGETPDAGQTTSASGEASFTESGCETDVNDSYEKFISLRYSYALQEETARTGYNRHDLHRDDLPIEVITTDASEHGANAEFADEYGNEITVDGNLSTRSAKTTLLEREEAAGWRLTGSGDTDSDGTETFEAEVDRVTNNRGDEGSGSAEQPVKPETLWQKIVRFFLPSRDMTSGAGEEKLGSSSNAELNIGSGGDMDTDSDEDQADETEDWETDLVNDLDGSGQSASTATDADWKLKSGMSGSKKVKLASGSNAVASLTFTEKKSSGETSPASEGEKCSVGIYAVMAEARTAAASSGLFTDAYNLALGKASSGDEVPPGPDDNYSHCNNQDGEGDSWRIYDHRTEGELHINKRDMDLKDIYGAAQGDAVLEGAVYGLYASDDIVHPDGKTGVVYRRNNLVAVTSTDLEGDASFLTCTEAPGMYYDYAQGKITKTEDSWAEQAPGNLYVQNISVDDYTEDGRYEREYADNAANNGNCWIGRPLLMGDYYVKELTRSEGYELSIGNRQQPWTNRGQDCQTAALPEGDGYANITGSLFAEQQISAAPTGDYHDPDYNELFFSAESMGTDGFDLVCSGLPEGSRLYRLDRTLKDQEVLVGTGEYEEVGEVDEAGNPVYVVAESDCQYPKYEADGSLMMREVPVDALVDRVEVITRKPLDEEKTQEVLLRAMGDLTEAQVLELLASEFDLTAAEFVKEKLSLALRANQKNAPKGGGAADVTEEHCPLVTLMVAKTDEGSAGSEPLKTGDLLATLLDFYNTSDFYSYGGLNRIEETEEGYSVTLYAGRTGNPDNFFVPGEEADAGTVADAGADVVENGILYHRVAAGDRFVYARYASETDSEAEAFGIWKNLTLQQSEMAAWVSARLVTDAVADETGKLSAKRKEENVWYQKGEIPCGADGLPIQKVIRQETTVTEIVQAESGVWTELPIRFDEGKLVGHIESSYRDCFGVMHQDREKQEYEFKLVVPDRFVTLTQEDVAAMSSPGAWAAGDLMSAAAYYLQVKDADVHAYLNYADRMVGSANSFVQPITLIYPGQEFVWQDGSGRPGTNTRVQPVGVEERVIRQQMKVTKIIDEKSYNNTSSYTEVHEDWWTKLFGGFFGVDNRAKRMENFRFRTYLKSNLERIYRDEEGHITWQDNKGNETDPLQDQEHFPEKVRKIFTKVLHQTEPLYQDSRDAVIANSRLYDEDGGVIASEQNPGWTAVLETVTCQMEDGAGVREVQQYNYDKFFDALAVADHDKWEDHDPTYTSWRPIGNVFNRTEETMENTKSSDRVRQFAIDWYLDNEVLKLGLSEVAHSDEFYDKALQQAIIKAENYLKPFFEYDLNRIYAVEWDSETDGGRDGDRTTLSADQTGDEAECCYGTSVYLPYGTYVIVEQQPRYADLEDFKNRHYQIDKPREVILPAVYEDYEGSQKSPELFAKEYRYEAELEPEEQERKFQIRFHQESRVIRGHGHFGDFEVYPYGQDIERVVNGAPDEPGAGQYYALTQSEYRPCQNHYNETGVRSTGSNPYYLTEGQDGREAISGWYRYSSLSEHEGTADDVPYPDGTATEDNVPGIWYRDGVATMHGEQTAYDGLYAPMLVPYTVMAPANEEEEHGASAENPKDRIGFAYGKFCNRLYTAKLRIEKLDSETHENILHDGALFQIYAAKRNDEKNGEGEVLFYEEDTLIRGTKLFLEAMQAKDIQPMMRGAKVGLEESSGVGILYTGIVPAGTPICEEAEQIILGDEFGLQTAKMKTYSTVRDGRMQESGDEDGETPADQGYGLQTVGYLETPQPLSAGTYVICEVKAPSGYVRSKPVALEIYSDKIAYYKNGNRDDKVLSALYEYNSDHPTENKTKPQDQVNVARVYVENTPIQVKVEKLKDKSEIVTYKVGGRIDGTLAEIGGDPDYIYAYENGRYLGYAWRKGTLEYLTARKAAGEDVDIVYEGSRFAGYGFVTRAREMEADENPYVPGAKMALFDALELHSSGDSEDHAYAGLMIERNAVGNVTRMYVKEGFAGEKTEFVREKDAGGQELTEVVQTGVDQSEDPIQTEGAVWSAVTIQRHDTDILYYDLDDLTVTVTETVDGETVVYGYDRNHHKVPILQAESDRLNYQKTDAEHSLTVFKDGSPYLEIAGGDFTKLHYDQKNKLLEVGEQTLVYHLDRDGSRDALVDPYTGMAYVEETADPSAPFGADRRVLVWPVVVHRDADGNVVARDKVMTSRIAAVKEDEEGGYITGSWQDEPETEQKTGQTMEPATEQTMEPVQARFEKSSESHHEMTILQNDQSHNQNEEVLTDDNNGAFAKRMEPVWDAHGLPQYYSKSDAVYDKSTDLYDRNDDFVRQQDSDKLEEYNQAAYEITEHEQLFDGEEILENQQRSPLYHRLGEGYILENTWITSEKTPNDPFHDEMTEGQADILKRLPVGHYIMEELISPDGYLKGMPEALQVEETKELQKIAMTDLTTKVEIGKVDYGNSESGQGNFGMVEGAVLALYPVRQPKQPMIQWTTTNAPIYLEGIPVGDYLLKEVSAPDGFSACVPMEVRVENTSEVQVFLMEEDHTKIEIEKYYQDGREKKLLPGAGFTLYEIQKDQNRTNRAVAQWTTGNRESYAGFAAAFEEMYRLYGATPRTSVVWSDTGRPGGAEHRAEYEYAETIDASVSGGNGSIFPTKAVLVFRTDSGEQIRITVYGQSDNLGGRDFTYEYQFDWKKLPEINEYACCYQTLEGRTRLSYLPRGLEYQLVETEVPAGFAKAEPVLIRVLDSSEVQLYQVENVESTLRISKTCLNRPGELPGAHLGLYRPAEDGTCIQDEEHLLVDWITGEDGGYTELDAINQKIPEGYQAGDVKPHTIRRMPDGDYWLAELECPDYYTTFEPILISYHHGDEVRVIRVSDAPAKGSLEIIKISEEGSPLAGATFALAAYKEGNAEEPVLSQTVYGFYGTVTVKDLPVGEVQGDGSILPYRYQLWEITPPDGYAVNPTCFTWQFDPNQDGVSYGPGQQATEQIVVEDERTRIEIGKRDFGNPEDWVSGARLAVYDILGWDEKDELKVDEEHPIAEWTTVEPDTEKPNRGESDTAAPEGRAGEYIIEGLTAGRSYLLKELEAPSGYHLMKPVIFTLSADGRKICEVTDRINRITVHYAEELPPLEQESGKVSDRIESVTVRGRHAVRVDYQAEQKETDQTITEYTQYSDGSSLMTGRWTGAGNLEEKIHVREAAAVKLTLSLKDGDVVDEFQCSGNHLEWTIPNDNQLFQKGEHYILTETTEYSDGSVRESNRLAFTLGEDGAICQILALNRQTEAALSKVDITGGEELPGCHMTVLKEDGTVVETWTSQTEPHVLKGVLEPGESYILREERPADGYAYAADILFTMNEEGVVEMVMMQDEETKIRIRKVDADTGEALAGAQFEIRAEDGTVVEHWTSTEEAHEVQGKLDAEGTYILHEVQAPAGYQAAEDRRFTVPRMAETLELVCKNKKKPSSSHSGNSGSETPKEVPKVPELTRIGHITAVYISDQESAAGWLYFDEDNHLRMRLPGMGQDPEVIPALWVMSLAILGLSLVFRKCSIFRNCSWRLKKKG